MSRDCFQGGVLRDARLIIGLANTTDVCRRAQGIHESSELVTIAMGRMITSAALATFSQTRKGQLSLQMMGKGQLGNMFVDVTHEGRIRTMVKHPQVHLPRLPGESAGARRSVGHGFGAGTLSVIWQPLNEAFTQSSTPIVDGEVDSDVEFFLTNSDQVRTALMADTLVKDNSVIERAGGLLLQAMPDANARDFDAVSAELRRVFAKHLLDDELSFAKLASLIGQPIEVADEPVELEWQCRCSYERVLNGLRMLGAVDLAEMVANRETAKVRCEFCHRHYEVPPNEVRELYEAGISAEN